MAKEGLAKIKEEDFDLVLCDIKNAKMDGIEASRAGKSLRIDHRQSSLSLISSPWKVIETCCEGYKKGAFDFHPNLQI